MRAGPARRLPWTPIFLSAALVAYSSATAALGLEGWPYVSVNVVVAFAVFSFVRKSGFSTSELGLSREAVRPGFLAGGIALGVFVLCLGLASVWVDSPTRAASSIDCGERLATVGELVQALFRVAIGTAFAEELLFRGALLAVWNKRFGSGCSATMGVAVPFSLWHVVPTIVNQGRCSADLIGTVAVSLVVTFMAGIFLVWLRRRTQGILGPVLVHTIVNGGLIAGGYILSL